MSRYNLLNDLFNFGRGGWLRIFGLYMFHCDFHDSKSLQLYFNENAYTVHYLFMMWIWTWKKNLMYQAIQIVEFILLPVRVNRLYQTVFMDLCLFLCVSFGCRNVVCAACEDGSLNMFYISGSRCFPSIVLDSKVSKLHIKTFFIMVITQKAFLYIWWVYLTLCF